MLAERATRAALLTDEKEPEPEPEEQQQDMGSLTGWQALADQVRLGANLLFVAR